MAERNNQRRPPSQVELEATWGRKPAAAVKILRWAPQSNAAGTMEGYISAEMPSGIIINSLKLMIGPKGRRWIAVPSVKAVDKDGNPVLDRTGKQIWNNFIDFRDDAARERFRDQVLDALRRQHPELFDGGVP